MFFGHVFSKNKTRALRGSVLCSLLFALCSFAPAAHAASGPVQYAGGGNLTGWAGNIGAMNNNQWNQAMNPGKGTPPPAADFGNCNAVILRCAQPRCASGGCTDMDVAAAIANGCVTASAECAKHGAPLVNYIAAQLVAQSTARANQQMAAAQAQAGANAAEESAYQMQQMQMEMQSQMAQMQQQMAMQAEESNLRLEAALAQQAALQQAAAPAPAAYAAPAAAGSVPAMDVTTQIAAAHGISADVLLRERAGEQILDQLQTVKKALETTKTAMVEAFRYAGCDDRGDNCTGPRRVAAFKQKATQFFDPYETVKEEVLNALYAAQTLGVDLTDIYMMLNDACNVWGKFMCTGDQVMRYSSRSPEECDRLLRTGSASETKGIICPRDESERGKIVPEGRGGCRLVQTLNNNETILQSWLYRDEGTNDVTVQVGCVSDVLMNSPFFRNQQRKTMLDIEDLALVLATDYLPATNPQPDQACATRDQTNCNRCLISSGDPVEVLQNFVMRRSIAITSADVAAAGAQTVSSLPPSIASNAFERCLQTCSEMAATYPAEKVNCINGCNSQFGQRIAADSMFERDAAGNLTAAALKARETSGMTVEQAAALRRDQDLIKTGIQITMPEINAPTIPDGLRYTPSKEELEASLAAKQAIYDKTDEQREAEAEEYQCTWNATTQKWEQPCVLIQK